MTDSFTNFNNEITFSDSTLNLSENEVLVLALFFTFMSLYLGWFGFR